MKTVTSIQEMLKIFTQKLSRLMKTELQILSLTMISKM